MGRFSRRELFRTSLGAAVALSPAVSNREIAASDKVVLGVMGCGGRGSLLAKWFAALPGVEIAYLCDVNERRFEWALEGVEQAQGKSPELVNDFRRILDDKAVDALVNATPDHWHAIATIMACQAGKDVYVEKPLSHDIWEGKQMIAATWRTSPIVSATGSSVSIRKLRIFRGMRRPTASCGVNTGNRGWSLNRFELLPDIGYGRNLDQECSVDPLCLRVL